MKFAGYKEQILLCKHARFREKNYYNSRDIEFFLGDYFFIGAPCKWRQIIIIIIKFFNVA